MFYQIVTKKHIFLISFCLTLFSLSLMVAISYSYETTLRFIDKTSDAGLSYPPSPSYGLSWGDFNDDYLIDLYIGNHGQRPSLYKNSGYGVFIDITLESGIQLEGDFHGASWGDFDNDGDLDLYQTLGADKGFGNKNNYLSKNEDGFFTDIAGDAGVQDPQGRGRMPVWLDYDKDGRLDLFIANQERADAPSRLFKNKGDETFIDVTESAGLQGIERAIGAYLSDINSDGAIDLFLSSPAGGITLYINNGDGTFRDSTIGSGLENVFSVKDLNIGDYDNDGHFDIFIVRGSSSSDAYELDAGKLYFSLEFDDTEKGFNFEIQESSIVDFVVYVGNLEIPTSYIYIGSGKYNPESVPFSLDSNDSQNLGQPLRSETGVYIWFDDSNNQWHLFFYRNPEDIEKPYYLSGIISTPGSFGLIEPVGLTIETNTYINRLFRNKSNGQFYDVTAAAGLSLEFGNAISAASVDFDNDGDLDIYVVYPGGLQNAANRLYENDGQCYFVDVAGDAGAEALVKGVGESVAVADYNNDGFVDMMILNGAGNRLLWGHRVLLENQGTGNSWIQLKLVGEISNRKAIGSIVTLEAGSLRLSRQQMGGMHRFSQNSQILQFGLGQEEIVDKITIHWPNGIVQKLFNVNVDQRLVVKEPKVSLMITPETTVVPQAGILGLQATATNNTGEEQVFLFATNVTLPDGNPYPPLPKPFFFAGRIAVSPYETVTKHISHEIPMDAPLGGYFYNGYVGKGLVDIWDEDRFEFTVVPASGRSAESKQ